MVQAAGIALILIGGVFWHIAAGSENPANINEVWRDILKTLEGEK